MRTSTHLAQEKFLKDHTPSNKIYVISKPGTELGDKSTQLEDPPTHEYHTLPLKAKPD